MNQGERNQKIEDYGRGYDRLLEALADIPREAWDYKPSAEDWSVHEILVHMGDSESMAALRLRKLIVEPGSTLMGYDESKWAGALEYQKQDADDALQIIKLARQTSYRLLKTLPEEAFAHAVKHPEYSEPYTFDKWLSIYARHIPDHVEQMKKSYEAWKKK
jgi:uncharacterized damage-inducible protein DinB